MNYGYIYPQAQGQKIRSDNPGMREIQIHNAATPQWRNVVPAGPPAGYVDPAQGDLNEITVKVKKRGGRKKAGEGRSNDVHPPHHPVLTMPQIPSMPTSEPSAFPEPDIRDRVQHDAQAARELRRNLELEMQLCGHIGSFDTTCLTGYPIMHDPGND